MYEAHFGLKSNPFGAKTDGAGVFVGPEQNKVINSLQKGLGTQDAVITLTGPVGVGKTTIITRALQAMSPGRTAAWVGRMQFGANELTELLLGGFGIESKSKGPVRRFAAFRRLTQIQADNGAPVAIIVEDTHRVGIDALDELEALTSADSGDTNGANIILMGKPGLHEMLKAPELSRLHQRMRLRQELKPLSTAEVQGYLKHVVRQAGGDFDQLFESGVVDIVAQCSGGIPRMINSLCATALSAAKDAGQKQISRTLLAEVASNTFGFEYEEETPASTVMPEPEPAKAEVKSADEKAKTAPASPETKRPAKRSATNELPASARDIVVESGRYPETDNGEPAAQVPAQVPADDDNSEDEIPELINDTQPELEQIDPGAMNASANADQSVSEAVHVDATSPQKILTATVDVPDLGQSKPEQQASADTRQSGVDGAGEENDEPAYSLDDALSPDTESTNMMKGITAEIDALPSDIDVTTANAKSADARADISDELPTLSESMRVHAMPKAEAAIEKGETAATPDAADLAGAPTEFEDTATLAAALEAAHLEAAHLQELEEAADAATAKSPVEADNPAPQALAPDAGPTAESPNNAPEVPEITLDGTLDRRGPEPQTGKNREELEKFAEEIGAANSLEDISELMAETLFGNHDLDQIAAEVTANPPVDHAPSPVAVDNPVAADTEAAAPAAATTTKPAPPVAATEESGMPPALQQPKIDPVATGEIELSLEMDESGIRPGAENANDVAEKSTPEPAVAAPAPSPTAAPAAAAATPDGTPHNLRDSVAMRIDMLNKMNAAAKPAAAKPAKPKPAPKPESIEEQITTSLTQTLEALKVSKKAAPATAVDDDDEDEAEEKKSGGLFSRFRRSS